MDCLTLRPLIHYGLHFVFPLVIAYFYNAKDWKRIYLLLLSTMLVDMDHLLANPIFDANRNSVGFHYLHTYPAIGIYLVVFIFGKSHLRILALGLLFHMLTDFQDSLWYC